MGSTTSFLSPKTEVRPAQSMGADCSPARPSPGMKLSPIKGGHIFDRQPAARTAAAPGSAEMQIADDLFIGPADAELVAARSLPVWTGRKSELQKKYRGCFSWYLERKIRENLR